MGGGEKEQNEKISSAKELKAGRQKRIAKQRNSRENVRKAISSFLRRRGKEIAGKLKKKKALKVVGGSLEERTAEVGGRNEKQKKPG